MTRALLLLPMLALVPWTAAAQRTPAPAASPAPLDPTAPLAPLPDLGVAWPDLNVRDPLEAPPAASGVQADATPRYNVVLAGADALPTVRERFDALSVLRKDEGKPANAGQIDRRAKDDVELLTTLLRAAGYYDAGVDTLVTPAAGGGRVTVTLTVTPGPLYRFADVKVQGLPPAEPGAGPAAAAAAPFRDAFAVDRASPIAADPVLDAQANLLDRLKREGYPFAKVGDPQVTVDHETREGTLALAVEAGGRRQFGGIVVQGARAPFGAKHAAVIARFRPGDLYDQALVADYQRALTATGIVGQAKVDVVEGRQPGTVDVVTALEPAPLRTLAGSLGYGTGEGFQIEGSWQNRNLIKPEGAVTFRGVAGTQEQLLGAVLRVNNFGMRDRVLNARALLQRQNLPAYDASTVEFGANLERVTTLIWQKPWTYSYGAELIATRQRNVDPARGALVSRTFLIGALPVTLGVDQSNDLLNPTTGFRLFGRFSPEVSLQGTTFGYARSQFDASVYRPVGTRVVAAARVRLGSIVGAGVNRIAPSRLFYAGGGGSVRGYGYQAIGPRDALGAPTGGRSLAEFSLEARIRLPQFGGNFGVVPFLDGGQVYQSAAPTFRGLRLGAGVGLRYYSQFGPIRIDVGTPLGRRRGESLVAVQVSLGQAF